MPNRCGHSGGIPNSSCNSSQLASWVRSTGGFCGRGVVLLASAALVGGTRQQRGKLLAQLLWLVAALLTVALDGGLVFVVAITHVDLSVRDLMQLNAMFSVILVSYAAVTYLGWKLLPASSRTDVRAKGGGGNKNNPYVLFFTTIELST